MTSLEILAQKLSEKLEKIRTDPTLTEVELTELKDEVMKLLKIMAIDMHQFQSTFELPEEK